MGNEEAPPKHEILVGQSNWLRWRRDFREHIQVSEYQFLFLAPFETIIPDPGDPPTKATVVERNLRGAHTDADTLELQLKEQHRERIEEYKFDLKRWEKQQARVREARKYLYSVLDPSIRVFISKTPLLSDAYAALRKQFRMEDSVSQAICYQKLESLKLSQFKGMQEYITACYNAVTDLGECNGDYSDNQFMAKLLSGLTPAYNQLVIDVHIACQLAKTDKADSQTQITNEHVISRLLIHESLNSPKNLSTVVSDNKNGKKSKNKKDKEGKDIPKCPECKKPHKGGADSCWFLHPELNPWKNGEKGEDEEVIAMIKAKENNTTAKSDKKPKSDKSKGKAKIKIVALTYIPDINHLQQIIQSHRLDTHTTLQSGTNLGTSNLAPPPQILTNVTSQIDTQKSLSKDSCEQIEGGAQGTDRGNGPDGDSGVKQTCTHDTCSNTHEKEFTIEQYFPKSLFTSSYDCSQANTATMMICGDTGISKSTIILDTGANAHVVNNPDFFSELHLFDYTVNTADAQGTLQIKGGGTLRIPLLMPSGGVAELELQDVAYAPSVRYNIISPSLLNSRGGLQGTWGTDGMTICTSEGVQIGSATLYNGLYILNLDPDSDLYVNFIDKSLPIDDDSSPTETSSTSTESDYNDSFHEIQEEDGTNSDNNTHGNEDDSENEVWEDTVEDTNQEGSTQSDNSDFDVPSGVKPPDIVSVLVDEDFNHPMYVWHRRLGHLGFDNIEKLAKMSEGIRLSPEQLKWRPSIMCPVCAITKTIVKIPKDPASRQFKKPGELIHVDAWGPYPVNGHDNTKYAVTFTDHATRYVWVEPVHSRVNLLKVFQRVHRKIQKTYNIQIRRYRFDNEFGNSQDIRLWLESMGISAETTAANAHYQVGAAERLNRTMRERASAMTIDQNPPRRITRILRERSSELVRNSSLPRKLWPEAVRHSIWLKNRSPTRAFKDETPYQKLTTFMPDLNRERIWGSRVYVVMSTEERDMKRAILRAKGADGKLDPRGWLGYFVGHEHESNYRIWDPEDQAIKVVNLAKVDDGQGLDDDHTEYEDEDEYQGAGAMSRTNRPFLGNCIRCRGLKLDCNSKHPKCNHCEKADSQCEYLSPDEVDELHRPKLKTGPGVETTRTRNKVSGNVSASRQAPNLDPINDIDRDRDVVPQEDEISSDSNQNYSSDSESDDSDEPEDDLLPVERDDEPDNESQIHQHEEDDNLPQEEDDEQIFFPEEVPDEIHPDLQVAIETAYESLLHQLSEELDIDRNQTAERGLLDDAVLDYLRQAEEDGGMDPEVILGIRTKIHSRARTTTRTTKKTPTAKTVYTHPTAQDQGSNSDLSFHDKIRQASSLLNDDDDLVYVFRSVDDPDGKWTISNGIYRRNGHIYVPSSLRHDLIITHHTAVAAHREEWITLEELLEQYWWPDQRREICNTIRQCKPCKEAGKVKKGPYRIRKDVSELDRSVELEKKPGIDPSLYHGQIHLDKCRMCFRTKKVCDGARPCGTCIKLKVPCVEQDQAIAPPQDPNKKCAVCRIRKQRCDGVRPRCGKCVSEGRFCWPPETTDEEYNNRAGRGVPPGADPEACLYCAKHGLDCNYAKPRCNNCKGKRRCYQQPHQSASDTPGEKYQYKVYPRKKAEKWTRCKACKNTDKLCEPPQAGKKCSSCEDTGFDCQRGNVRNRSDTNACDFCHKTGQTCDYGKPKCKVCVGAKKRCTNQGMRGYNPEDPHFKRCTRCKRKKLPCDKKSPCTNCKDAGNQCWYEKPDRFSPTPWEDDDADDESSDTEDEEDENENGSDSVGDESEPRNDDSVGDESDNDTIMVPTSNPRAGSSRQSRPPSGGADRGSTAKKLIPPEKGAPRKRKRTSGENEVSTTTPPAPTRRQTRLQTKVINATTETKFDPRELPPEPKTFKAALDSLEGDKWKAATEDELQSLLQNNTWVPSKLPPGRKALSTRWVYKRKIGEDGHIARYKARLVARGFEQIHGIDFDETFAGVVKPPTYRLFFALMSLLGWHAIQADIKTAFLHGDVEGEVYIQIPDGVERPKGNQNVLKLRKTLYGLKQSPRAWYQCFSSAMVELGWRVSDYDSCIYIWDAAEGQQSHYLFIYVDDLHIVGPSQEFIDDTLVKISEKFDVISLGKPRFYLGMHIHKDKQDHVYVHQGAFIDQIIDRFELNDIHPVSTPMIAGLKLLKETTATADAAFVKRYQSMVGCISYLTTVSRPDLAHSFSVLSQFNANPNEEHMRAVERVFAYLKRTRSLGLHFRPGTIHSSLKAYVDSDWAGSDGSRSTTGWVIQISGAPISWSSKRQQTVALSSCEAEYMAASEAGKELIWLRGLLQDLNIPELGFRKGIKLFIDNQSALKLTKNPEFHPRTKHIELRYHWIREKVESGDIIPEWVSTKEQVADGFTKALARPAFEAFTETLGMSVGPTTEGVVANNEVDWASHSEFEEDSSSQESVSEEE